MPYVWRCQISYNGSGTFNINTAGQPVVTGTVISSTAFNALTSDLGTGLSTAITKDGQTTATARIPFAAGINSSLVTDATSTTTGSIITAGGVGIAKALFVGTTANIAGTTTLAGVTATSITDSGLTSGRVTYAGTAGLLKDSANLTFSGSALAVTGTLSATGANGGVYATPDFEGAGSHAIYSKNGANYNAFNYEGTSHNWWIGTTSTTVAMTLDASGNLLVGTTGASATSGFIHTNSSGSKYGWVNKGSNGSHVIASFNNVADTQVGSITGNNAATFYNATSDYRLKTVIGAVSGSGARIDALEPIEYEWNFDGSRTRGFLAHKFQEVYAGSVTGTKDAVDAQGNPVYQAMQASSAEVIADLVAEIQSLRKRITALEAK